MGPRFSSNKKRLGDIVSFHVGIPVRVSVPLVLFGAATIFSALYVKYPDWRESLKFIGAAVGVATALQSAYFAKRALETAVHDRQMAAAAEFFWKFYFDLRKERATFGEFASTKLKGQPAPQVISAFAEGENHLIATPILNFWEGVGYCVRRDTLDVAQVCDLMGSACIACYNMVQPWLEEFRRSKQQPTAFEHFEWLAQALKEHRRKN